MNIQIIWEDNQHKVAFSLDALSKILTKKQVNTIKSMAIQEIAKS